MFTKVLIANRGEIACRIIRTLRKMGVGSVAVYSDPDATAAHVLLADEAVRVGPAAAAESYLNVEAILDAARRTGAQAIHPGYGFLSENAAFARLCAENGIEFIGPTPEQLVDFGLKHKARELAERWQVPLVPGSGLLETPAAAKAAAAQIGYPVMLKSTAGGGGIGMCICRNDAELEEGFERIGRLSRNNFKESGLFVEKYIERARHVEVQIFGDGKGGIAILGERDCSVQRRNQKVVEETPAPNLPEATRRALHDAARRLGEGVAYRSAGTVEFIYDSEADRFYFLEVNTRLQVEHGVTEAVFGIDLVEWMVRLAAGEFPFEPGRRFVPEGAAMEFRVYAEDPGKNFQPSSGLVTQALFPAQTRCDAWISTGTEVSAFYDPLLAKIIVKGADRAEVLRLAERALAETKIAGFETNLLLLRDVLAMEPFRAGTAGTWLLKHYHYAAPTLEILAPGAQTTVQDYPGRLGYWAVGVPPSGPMDAFSFRLANRIVGNASEAPGLEMTLSGASLRFNTGAVFALTGGDFPATLNGTPIPRNTPLPTSMSKTYQTNEDHPDCVHCCMYQGNHELVANDVKIGIIKAKDIPVYPNVRSLISITFSIDINGVFSVSASVVGSEMPVTIEMLDSVLLTDKMIDNIIDEDKREKEEIIKEMREDLISEIELRLQDLENSDNYRMIALVARERDWLNENMYTGSVEELQQCLDRLK